MFGEHYIRLSGNLDQVICACFLISGISGVISRSGDRMVFLLAFSEIPFVASLRALGARFPCFSWVGGFDISCGRYISFNLIHFIVTIQSCVDGLAANQMLDCGDSESEI